MYTFTPYKVQSTVLYVVSTYSVHNQLSKEANGPAFVPSLGHWTTLRTAGRIAERTGLGDGLVFAFSHLFPSVHLGL